MDAQKSFSKTKKGVFLKLKNKNNVVNSDSLSKPTRTKMWIK